MNQFIKLFTGQLKFDNSMSRNTPRFWQDEFPLAVRPHLVESIRHIRHGDKVLSEVMIAGREYPVHCLNDADEILKQISDLESPRLSCEHTGMVTNGEGKSYCPDCGEEWNDANP